jgi:hypothetical protein
MSSSLCLLWLNWSPMRMISSSLIRWKANIEFIILKVGFVQNIYIFFPFLIVKTNLFLKNMKVKWGAHVNDNFF